MLYGIPRDDMRPKGVRFAPILDALMQQQSKRAETAPAVARVASAMLGQGQPQGSGNPLVAGIQSTADALGIDPLDLATAISYETAGTFDPTKAGPTTQWGRHRGLIQFGEPQARQYGVDWNDPLGSQLGPDGAVAKYLRDTGVQPGMGLLDIYSAINAGGVGRYDRSDANNGGAPGTVRDKVENQMAGHRRNAMKLLGGQSGFISTSGVATDIQRFRPRATRFEVDPGAPVTRQRLAEMDMEVARQYGPGATVRIDRQGQMQVMPAGGQPVVSSQGAAPGQGASQPDPVQAWADRNLIPLSDDMIPRASSQEIISRLQEAQRRGLRLSDRARNEIQRQLQLAQMYEQPNGEIMLRKYYTEMLGYQPQQPQQRLDRDSQFIEGVGIVDMDTGEVIKPINAQPDTGYRMMTPDEVAQVPQLDPQRAYQVGPDGKITAVGGSGQTINVNAGGPAAEPLGTKGQILVTDPSDPSGYRIEIAPNSELALEEEARKTAEQAKDEGRVRQADIILEDIGRIRDMLTGGRNQPITGTAGALASNIPGTEARDARELAKTIGANIGFDRLAQMRAESPTGGALGNVTVQEIQRLEAVLGNIEFSQSKEQLLQNLDRLEALYTDMTNKIRRTGDGTFMPREDAPAAETPEGPDGTLSDEQLLRKYGYID